MKLDEWLTTVPIQQTPQGAGSELRLYVYPDGHGDFCVEDGKGRLCSKPQPVNNPAEAHDVLERIWNRAMSLKPESTSAAPPAPTIADQFADVIGTVPDLPEDMAAQHDHYVHGAPKS